MPVLEATGFTPPRSALRHRPISKDGTGSGKRPQVTNATPPVVKRASRQQPGTADADSEVDEWQRTEDDPSSNRSTQAPVRRASAITGPKTLPKTPKPTASALGRAPKRHAHPLLYLGLGMLVMLALWTGLMGLASWFNIMMDDIHYGYPRTFQIDQFVGHSESGGIPSHFLAINFHSRIEVIEFPGGDATHARIFIGPQLYTDGSDLVPVTLSFLDVNSDRRPDMIIEFQGSQVAFIFSRVRL
jgi:hypothetical protein